MATSNVPTKWKGKCAGGQDFNSSLCNSKHVGVRYFNEGLRFKIDPLYVQFNDSVRDVTGHGMHCSSIAAGNYVDGVSYFGYCLGTAKGIAPRARLAVYKVLWSKEHLNNGAGTTAAIDKAIADGVDVISDSWSYAPMSLHCDPLAKASFAAMKRGLVVSTAAGNYGPEIGTLRNRIPWVLTVTAGTVDRWFAGVLTLGNGLTIVGWSTFPDNKKFSSSNTFENLPLVYNKTISSCSSSNLLSQTHMTKRKKFKFK